MKLIRQKIAFYPAFHLGSEPRAIECQIAIVEANGKRYLKTPFAMLNAYNDEDIERSIGPGKGYYATEEETMAYLANEYPWWKQAAIIMDELMTSIHHHGTLVGPCRVADKYGVATDKIYVLARGHKSFTLKAIRQALKSKKVYS